MNDLLMICGGDGREPTPERMPIEAWVQSTDGRGIRLFGRALDPPDGRGYGLVFHGHRAVFGIEYWVAARAQGQGFATRAAGLLSRWALQAGAVRVEALLDPHNDASRRVAEKWGFLR
jgi:RimJ/RimL family protein N-acetyltransferase